MSDSLTTDIVVALTSTAAKSLADGGSQALLRLAGAIRDRFRREPAARGALEIALENPDDPQARRALVQLLDAHAHTDPEFARQLRVLWADAAAETSAKDGPTTNTVSGDVGGSVVQARDVHGSITLGPTSSSPTPRTSPDSLPPS